MCFLSKAANLAVLMLVAANAWRNFAHRARSCRSIAIATKPSAVRVGYRYLTPACNTPAGYLGRQCVCRRCYSDESTWGTIGPNGDVRQYALNVDNNNSTSRNYSSSIEKGTKKNLDDVGSTDWYELLALVKSRNFDAAMAMYDQLDLKAIPIKQRRKMLFLSISACYKKDHLRKAKKIIDDMTDNDVVLTEQCYLSLIRCYSDGMMIDEAVATIKLMTRLEIEPKIRNLHPIIEAACNYNNAVIGEDTISDVVGNTASTNTVGATSASSGNSKDGALKVLEILQLAKDLNIKIWSEHIVLFIEMLSRSNILMNDEKLRAVANEMISELSSDITEVPVDQVVRIAKAVHGYYNVCSNSGTQNNSMKCMDEEVLVNSVHDIVDQIVDKSQLGIDGSLIAVNTNITDRNTRGSYFQNLFWNGKDILLNTTKISSNSSGIDSESDNDLDVMEDKSDEGIDGIDNLVLPPVPIKYYVKEEMKSLGIYTLEDNTHSKLVSISDEDSVCPNCKNVLESIRITNEEKLKVKQALISIVEEISEKQKSHLEVFKLLLAYFAL